MFNNPAANHNKKVLIMHITKLSKKSTRNINLLIFIKLYSLIIVSNLNSVLKKFNMDMNNLQLIYKLNNTYSLDKM